jgi:hypothetical protein
MSQQQWYGVKDAWPWLGFKDAEALRRWIRKGKAEGWLKIGTHIKPLYPRAKRSTWMVHMQRCQDGGFGLSSRPSNVK